MDLRTVRADWNSEPLTWGEPLPLTQADIVLLQEAPKGTSEAGAVTPLTRIRERHHALARLLATGACSMGEASILTGYDISRISILKNDPSFKELVLFYQNEVSAEYKTMSTQLAGLGSDALDELRRRVEEEPEKIGFNTLLDTVVKIADRTGNGPSSTTKSEVTVTIDLASKMKAARERARLASIPVEVEATAIDITPKAAAE